MLLNSSRGTKTEDRKQTAGRAHTGRRMTIVLQGRSFVGERPQQKLVFCGRMDRTHVRQLWHGQIVPSRVRGHLRHPPPPPQSRRLTIDPGYMVRAGARCGADPMVKASVLSWPRLNQSVCGVRVGLWRPGESSPGPAPTPPNVICIDMCWLHGIPARINHWDIAGSKPGRRLRRRPGFAPAMESYQIGVWPGVPLQ